MTFLFFKSLCFLLCNFFFFPTKRLKRHNLEKPVVSLGFMSAGVIRKGTQQGGRNSVAGRKGTLAGMGAELLFPGVTLWPDCYRVEL